MEITTQQPLVSICIACFNASATITGTICSILQQSYRNMEIIVSDNQSTDNTVEKVNAINDPRIKVFVNDVNVGMSKNFELAVSRASGIYVKLLCADDLLSHDCIEKQVMAFLNNPDDNLLVVAAEKWVINEKGKKLFVKKFPGRQGVYNGIRAIKKSLRHGTTIFGEPGCILYKKEGIDMVGSIAVSNDITYVFDFNLTCRVLKHGNIYIIKEPLFFFRVITTSYTANALWETPKVMNRLINKFQKEKLIHLSFFDLILAGSMSWLMCFGRVVIFSIANRNNTKKST